MNEQTRGSEILTQAGMLEIRQIIIARASYKIPSPRRDTARNCLC